MLTWQPSTRTVGDDFQNRHFFGKGAIITKPEILVLFSQEKP